jgi:hypothetical protein
VLESRIVESLPIFVQVETVAIIAADRTKSFMALTFAVRLLGHTANRQVVKHLSEKDQRSGSKWTENPSCSPDSVEQPYLRLGTHPNVVTRLWNNFSAALPAQCNWVVYGTPVLINPASAVIFACGLGTAYALRLPENARTAALELGLGTVHRFSDGVVLDLADFGDGWVFGRGLTEEQRWCVTAFEHAGE